MSELRPPRRDEVVALLAEERRALHVNEIATRLNVSPGAYTALQRLLDDLAYDGSVAALPGQRFRLTREQQGDRGKTLEGILGMNPRGFGFVTSPGSPDDVFIPAEALRGAIHGDQVTVRIVTRSQRGFEGEIVAIVKRRNARIAGTLRRRGRSAWLEPDDTRVRGPIVLVGEKALDAEDGMAAVVTITRFPELADENPEGTVEAVLGKPGEPKVEVAKILMREGIEEAHPEGAVREAEAYGDHVREEDLAGRVDLTHLPLPTIDPEDARDHDDAVWVVQAPDGKYTAWIAIADVSQYVRPGTALDASSLQRGNSIYLPDRAIPMLPRALSSNLCSLLPDVIRLCLCAEVVLDATGAVLSSRLVEGYMRSQAKLTYQGVARALGFTSEPKQSAEAEALREDLKVMWDLSRLLRSRRMRRGALDFDLPEAKVVLDPSTGGPVDVQKRAHDPGVAKAYHLIEELMLLANETVAKFLVEKDVPTIFRVHGPPDEAKLDRFATMCAELDCKFEIADALDAKKLSAFLKKLSVHPQKQVLHLLLLRAMRQAAYDTTNIGHFGLASSAYLHFTSPIRRYPDLVVHRAVRAILRHEAINRSDTAKESLRSAAVTASETERKGMDVEREIVDLHRAIVMQSHIGRVYEGIVTAIVGTGVFVNLDQPFVDVLVRMESLGPDRYEIDDEKLRVIGVRSGDRIAIGDRMLVQIEDVSILRRTTYAKRMASATHREEGAGGREKRKVKRTKGTDMAKRGGFTQAAKAKPLRKGKIKPKGRKKR